MPELPEVETVARQLDASLKDKEIIGLTVFRKENLRHNAERLIEDTYSLKIISAHRRAKFIQIQLSNSNSIVVHLRMTGQLLLKEKSEKPDKYVRALFELKEKNLWFRDIRTFGTIDYLSKKELKDFFEPLGPEPLSESFTAKNLREILQNNKQKNIKSLLLDQLKIAGIGNIYASEMLFESAILPERNAGSLTAQEVKKLYTVMRRILKIAIKHKGCSDNTYRDVFYEKGSYNKLLKVYRRTGLPCFTCNNGHIERSVIQGRSTFFCSNCQK